MTRWTVGETDKCKELLQSGLTYKEISNLLKKTPKSIKLRMNRMGLTYNSFKIKFPKVVKFCECCGEQIKNTGLRFCSTSCAAKINNSLYPKRTKLDVPQTAIHNKRIRLPKTVNQCISCGYNCYNLFCNATCHSEYKNTEKIKAWKDGIDVGYTGKTKQIKKFIRRYLLDKNNHQCSRCGWNKIHPITNICPLDVHHIDGDAENCKEENLEVICSDCHSLTPNFRNLNSNSKRKRNGV